jgi:hypothetical protein
MNARKQFTYFEFFSSINYHRSFTTLLTLLIQPFFAPWVIKQEHSFTSKGTFSALAPFIVFSPEFHVHINTSLLAIGAIFA